MRILIIGKPRSGKSTLARNLAVRLDLVIISVDSWFDSFSAKIKEQPDPSEVEPVFETKKQVNPETGEEEEIQIELPPPEWRTALEVSVQTTMERGGELSQEDIDSMILEQMYSNNAMKKGYVLDLDFTRNAGKTWAERLLGMME